MAKFTSILNAVINLLKRGTIGFVAGFIVVVFALVFLGMLLPHNDLSQPELDQQSRSLWIAFCIACGTGIASTLIGKRPVSRYWLWFCVAFGLICVIPFWPHKGNGLLPFGTPYVNFGFHSGDAIILAVHVSIALTVAAIIHWLWPMVRRRKAE